MSQTHLVSNDPGVMAFNHDDGSGHEYPNVTGYQYPGPSTSHITCSYPTAPTVTKPDISLAPLSTTVPGPRINTAQQWAAIKDAFIEVYHQPNTTLAQAMQTMAERHNFYATKAMYKKRIKKWNVKKSLSAQEKELLGAQAEELLAKDLEVPRYRESGLAIQWNRVRRRDRMLKKRVGLWDAVPELCKPRGTHAGGRALHRERSVVCTIDSPASMAYAERLLYDMRLVFDWKCSLPLRVWADTEPTSLKLYEDCNILRSMNMIGQLTKFLWRAALQFQADILSHNPMVLLNDLLRFRQSNILCRASLYQRAIVAFLSRAISAALPPSHPLVKCVTTILERTDHDRPSCYTVICQALLDSCHDQESGVVHQVRLQLIQNLIRDDSLDQAHHVCSQSLTALSQPGNQNLYWCMTFSISLGRIEHLQNRPLSALHIWTNTLQMPQAHASGITYTISQLVSLLHTHLAYLYSDLHDLAKSKLHFYLALKFSLSRTQPHSASTAASVSVYDALDDLINFLTKHNLTHELAQLRNEYPDPVGELLRCNVYPFDAKLETYIRRPLAPDHDGLAGNGLGQLNGMGLL